MQPLAVQDESARTPLVNRPPLTLLHSTLLLHAAFSLSPAPSCSQQIEAIRAYVDAGGSLLALGTDGSDASALAAPGAAASSPRSDAPFGTSVPPAGSSPTGAAALRSGPASPNEVLNAVTAPYGISLNSDAVVRTVYHKYLHPKEVYIGKGGVVIDAFAGVVAKMHAKSRAAAVNLAGGASGEGGSSSTSPSAASGAAAGKAAASAVELAYPRGCTLSLARPSVPLLSSGAISYPVCRPIGAVSEVRKTGGRVAVLGSAEMFTDDWLGKEHNAAVVEALFRWLVRADKAGGTGAAAAAKGSSAAASSSGLDEETAAAIKAAAAAAGVPAPVKPRRLALGEDDDEGDLDAALGEMTSQTSAFNAEAALRRGGGGGTLSSGAKAAGARKGAAGGDSARGGAFDSAYDADSSHLLPDTASLSERLRSCLQEPEPIPRDFHRLFDDTLFKFDTRTIPETVALYEALGVKHEPLSLIPPQFEAPLPSLQPAVFPPAFRDLPPPALELFDLDEHFASERSRLAVLTNKCAAPGDGGAPVDADADLEFFIREAGLICGITPKAEALFKGAGGGAAGGAGAGSSAAGGVKAPADASASSSSPSSATPKQILYYLLRSVAQLRRHDPSMPLATSGGAPGAAAAAAAANAEGSGGVIPGSSPLRHGTGSGGVRSGVGAGYKHTVAPMQSLNAAASARDSEH